MEELFNCIREERCRLVCLFADSGANAPVVPLKDLPDADWARIIDVNSRGVSFCIKEAFRLMKGQSPRSSRTINNGSISAHAPRPDALIHSATNHAVTGLTKAAALDGRKYGIAVGQIDIGNTETAMTDRLVEGEG